jgi:hypothetical protein
MNAQKLESLLTHLAGAAMSHNTHQPVLLWGESGVGKSETVARVAAMLGIGFVDLRLGQMEPGDLVGLPIDEVIDGRKVMRWSRPEWMPTEGRGIIFLDETNRSGKEVRNAVFQLLLDRRINTHELPDGWIIVGACNPPTDDYDMVDTTQDHAFVSRFLHVAFQPTADEWLTYAEQHNFDWSIRAFIADDTGNLGQRHAQLPDGIAPTPRSWSILARLLSTGLPHHLEMDVAAGLLGIPVAAAWLKLREDSVRPVKADEVLADYPAHRSRIIEQKANKRQDLLKVTMGDLCSAADQRNLDETELGHLVACILDMPEDIAYAHLKFRLIRNPRISHRLSANPVLFSFVQKINKAAGVE